MLWIGLAWAGDAESVQNLLAKEKVEAAQRRCERLSAFLPETEPALREVCAKAMLPKAQAADTFTGWVRFRDAWAGTTSAELARRNEARVRLAALGPEALEIAYTAFLEDYPDTPASAEATDLRAKAAVRGIDDLDEARRVARTYPGTEGLLEAIRPWFAGFLTATVDGDGIVVTLEPEIPIEGSTPQATFAARTDDVVQPWDDAALAHLQRHGLSEDQARLLLPGGGSYPPCSLPDLTLGAQVVHGPLEAFVPLTVDCGGDSPGFVSLRDGRVVGLALAPGPGIRLAGADGSAVLLHGRDASRAEVPLLGEVREEAIPLGTVVGRQVGPGWMLHPLAGGLPWYVLAGPPPSAQPIPVGHGSGPLPPGVSLVADSTGVRVEKAGSPSFLRTLPAGTVRALSPLYQELSSLHDERKVFDRQTLAELPAEGLPEGEEAPEVDEERRATVTDFLGRFGITPRALWSVPLRGDVAPEVAFAGTLAGTPVFGIVDPRRRLEAWRLFVVRGTTDGVPRVLEHGGHSLVAFPSDGLRLILRDEPRGLTLTRVR